MEKTDQDKKIIRIIACAFKYGVLYTKDTDTWIRIRKLLEEEDVLGEYTLWKSIISGDIDIEEASKLLFIVTRMENINPKPDATILEKAEQIQYLSERVENPLIVVNKKRFTIAEHICIKIEDELYADLLEDIKKKGRIFIYGLDSIEIEIPRVEDNESSTEYKSPFCFDTIISIIENKRIEIRREGGIENIIKKELFLKEEKGGSINHALYEMRNDLRKLGLFSYSETVIRDIEAAFLYDLLYIYKVDPKIRIDEEYRKKRDYIKYRIEKAISAHKHDETVSTKTVG